MYDLSVINYLRALCQAHAVYLLLSWSDTPGGHRQTQICNTYIRTTITAHAHTDQCHIFYTLHSNRCRWSFSPLKYGHGTPFPYDSPKPLCCCWYIKCRVPHCLYHRHLPTHQLQSEMQTFLPEAPP